MDPTMPAWETEITTVNRSDPSLTPGCEIMNPTLSFLIFIIALLGLAGNATVLWLLGFHMRRNAFTVYVINLAVADFLLLCSNVVYSLESIIHFILSIPTRIPSFLTVLFTFAYIVGLSMLSTISAERCLSALWPLWYRCRRPRCTSAVICVVLWALSLLLSLLEGKECGFLFKGSGSDWCQTLDVISGTWMVFLFVVLSASSLALLVRIFCSPSWVPVTKLCVTIALTVLAYLLFGLPFGINWFILTWIDGLYDNIPCIFHHVIIFLACVNSCVNPIIYFFVGAIRHRRFQQGTLLVLLQRAMLDTPEEESVKNVALGESLEKWNLSHGIECSIDQSEVAENKLHPYQGRQLS